MTQAYTTICNELEKDLSMRLERTLILKEQNAIRNAGSLMMLEVFERNFEGCQTTKEIEEQFLELYKMDRLDIAIEQLSNSYIKHKPKLDPIIESIRTCGNCLDVIKIMDYFKEYEQSNRFTKLIAARKLNVKLKLKLEELKERD